MPGDKGDNSIDGFDKTLSISILNEHAGFQFCFLFVPENPLPRRYVVAKATVECFMRN